MTVRGFGRAYQRRNGTWALSYYVNGREVRESVAKMLGKPPRAVTVRDAEQALKTRLDRKSTRLNSSHIQKSRMPSSA